MLRNLVICKLKKRSCNLLLEQSLTGKPVTESDGLGALFHPLQLSAPRLQEKLGKEKAHGEQHWRR